MNQFRPDSAAVAGGTVAWILSAAGPR